MKKVANVLAMIFIKIIQIGRATTPWKVCYPMGHCQNFWLVNSTPLGHIPSDPPRQLSCSSVVLISAPTTLCSHLQHSICCFVLKSINQITSLLSADGPPTERMYVVFTSSGSRAGPGTWPTFKTVLWLINGTQPMGKSLTDKKTCVSRELYKTHSTLSSARCPSRHLWHLTKLPEKIYIKMEATKPTTSTLPDESMSIHKTSKFSKQNG